MQLFVNDTKTDVRQITMKNKNQIVFSDRQESIYMIYYIKILKSSESRKIVKNYMIPIKNWQKINKFSNLFFLNTVSSKNDVCISNSESLLTGENERSNLCNGKHLWRNIIDKIMNAGFNHIYYCKPDTIHFFALIKHIACSFFFFRFLFKDYPYPFPQVLQQSFISSADKWALTFPADLIQILSDIASTAPKA